MRRSHNRPIRHNRELNRNGRKALRMAMKYVLRRWGFHRKQSILAQATQKGLGNG